MAYLQIKSSNPDLSHVIVKNPSSGMQIRECREGQTFGWFSQNNTMYNLYFKDSDTKVSYKSHQYEEYEYVNTSRFDSGMAYLNMIGDFFAYTVKKESDKDIDNSFENELFINIMYIKNPKYIDIFTRYMTDVTLSATELTKNHYEVIFKTKRSIRYLLNYVNLFLIFNVIKNKVDFPFSLSEGEEVRINEDLAAKYLNCLDMLDPPYLMRYVFKVNILKNPSLFKKYSKLLSTSKHYDSIELSFGSNAFNRRDTIKQKIGALIRNILDIGCGEGFYTFDFAKRIPEDKTIVAIDIDPEMQDAIKGKAKARQIENIEVYDSLNTFLETYQADESEWDVVLAEVVEHMEYDQAITFVKDILNKAIKTSGRLFLTTPNKDFNQFYDFSDEEARHDDHKFELTKDEFIDFINKVTGNYDYTIFELGDKVNGIPVSYGAVFERKMNLEEESKIQTG